MRHVAKFKIGDCVMLIPLEKQYRPLGTWIPFTSEQEQHVRQKAYITNILPIANTFLYTLNIMPYTGSYEFELDYYIATIDDD